MPSAKWLFEREGLAVTAATADVESAESTGTVRDWLPDAAALDG